MTRVGRFIGDGSAMVVNDNDDDAPVQSSHHTSPPGKLRGLRSSRLPEKAPSLYPLSTQSYEPSLRPVFLLLREKGKATRFTSPPLNTLHLNTSDVKRRVWDRAAILDT